ncbi:ABC transporter ATP-binding protein [Advenella alkanexedens]|uniref:ABC transporter ATP-binding protein n=1 Tax=Advenella alkanexedens TaxID=1481665 RepID=UPI000A4FF9A0|nr:ABC transporter ATP-binding protein [Advenella alkanexedens]WKU19423.1 ABC transporter ATP-binding protein [Advenella alkanexedens]
MNDHLSDSDIILRFSDVSLGYGERVILDHLNLQVKKGQVVALIGGSGSGKTTLLRAAIGQLIAKKGVVTAFGQDLAQVNPTNLRGIRQRMGVLFQQGALFTDLNVFENVAFPLRELTNDSEAVILDKVLDKLDAVGLKAAAHLAVSEISGGMARRVALARAIVLEPELVLYDEPFAGLDPISLGMTAQLIRNLSDRLGCASVLITHDIDESFQIVDQVYMVGRGELLASGTPEALRASEDGYVQQFLQGSPEGPVVFEYPDSPAFSSWLSKRKEGL